MDSELAVIGSFNWLSFEGRTDGKIRCEASVMISHPQKVREMFDEFSARFRGSTDGIPAAVLPAAQRSKCATVDFHRRSMQG